LSYTPKGSGWGHTRATDSKCMIGGGFARAGRSVTSKVSFFAAARGWSANLRAHCRPTGRVSLLDPNPSRGCRPCQAKSCWSSLSARRCMRAGTRSSSPATTDSSTPP